MLSKDKRLNLKYDFKPIVSSGFSTSTPSFKLSYRFVTDPVVKVGIALSGKSFKTAVLRNRAKRLTSQAVESHYPNLRKNLNLVIIPKPIVLEKTSDELVAELHHVKDLFTAN